jgi:hypothetical protein
MDGEALSVFARALLRMLLDHCAVPCLHSYFTQEDIGTRPASQLDRRCRRTLQVLLSEQLEELLELLLFATQHRL